MLKTEEINIRDPYILLHENRYYLYGTRSATCWSEADGFDCYVSDDRENWEGPIEIFHRPDGFFADRSYWAPECYFYQNAFYFVTTLEGEGCKKGIYVLRSESPTGPFVPYGEELTPQDWTSIDGTLYVEDGTPYLIFSHSFEDSPNGDMCMVELRPDLSAAADEPVLLFSAGEAGWAHPVPFAKAEFGMDGDVYFTDGPCVFWMPGMGLCMTWSSWGTCGYAVGLAVSESGSVRGPWRQIDRPIFPENGGHGMVFADKDGQLLFVLHYPNDKFQEKPCFMKLSVKDGEAVLV
ncbi:MAG: glycoside hydrolase family 43 protein [Lachnospiraceae bacterium]|nr:glycoside hydrolase family 43 protein [Lachnospiraceae bacterium]